MGSFVILATHRHVAKATKHDRIPFDPTFAKIPDFMIFSEGKNSIIAYFPIGIRSFLHLSKPLLKLVYISSGEQEGLFTIRFSTASRST